MRTVIFVFGSNLAGHHSGGAARAAFEHRGAEWGQAEGRQGDSYAIPTCDSSIHPLPILRVAAHIQTFLEYAKAHPELQFTVTRIGCGIAGFKSAQIAPLFKGAPANCELPVGWRNFKEDPDVHPE